MQGPLLIAETPNAGEIGHRYLVPAGIQITSGQAAALVDRLTGEGRLDGPTYLAIRRKAVQEYSDRTGWETLQVAGVDTARLTGDQRETIFGRLEHWLDHLVPAARAINWSRHPQLVAGSDALRDWQQQDFDSLPAVDVATKPEPAVRPTSSLPAQDQSRGAYTAALLAAACALMLLTGVGVYLYWPEPEQKTDRIEHSHAITQNDKDKKIEGKSPEKHVELIDPTSKQIDELLIEAKALDKSSAESPESAKVATELAELKAQREVLYLQKGLNGTQLDGLKVVKDWLDSVDARRNKAIRQLNKQIREKTASIESEVDSLPRHVSARDRDRTHDEAKKLEKSLVAKDDLLDRLPLEDRKQHETTRADLRFRIERRFKEWKWDAQKESIDEMLKDPTKYVAATDEAAKLAKTEAPDKKDAEALNNSLKITFSNYIVNQRGKVGKDANVPAVKAAIDDLRKNLPVEALPDKDLKDQYVEAVDHLRGTLDRELYERIRTPSMAEEHAREYLASFEKKESPGLKWKEVKEWLETKEVPILLEFVRITNDKALAGKDIRVIVFRLNEKGEEEWSIPTVEYHIPKDSKDFKPKPIELLGLRGHPEKVSISIEVKGGGQQTKITEVEIQPKEQSVPIRIAGATASLSVQFQHRGRRPLPPYGEPKRHSKLP